MNAEDVVMAVGTYQVCGDCAAALVARGGARNAALRTIGLGVTCETHGGSGPQASSVVDVDVDVARERSATFERAAVERVPVRELGPVTQIARDLLVAWSAEKEGANVDAVTIGRAVDVAWALLRETKGA
jgi:hypothetical protein